MRRVIVSVLSVLVSSALVVPAAAAATGALLHPRSSGEPLLPSYAR